MANTLGFDGESWLDFLDWLKQFELEIPDDEWRQVETVGDLYDLIMLHIPGYPTNCKCATAMAFFRLRRALSDLRHPQVIAPSTPLARIEATRLGFALKGLEGGLRVPCAPMRGVHAVIASGSFLAAIGSVVSGLQTLSSSDGPAGWIFVALLAIAAGGFWFLNSIPAKPTHDCPTVGRLAEHIAAFNYGSFLKLGARVSEDAVWDAICEGLAGQSGIPSSHITRETVFFANQLKKRAA